MIKVKCEGAEKVTPKLGPRKCSFFWVSSPTFVLTQARAVWQWYNYAAEAVRGNKIVLNINFDETSVAYYYGEGKGYVLVNAKDKSAKEAVTHAARGEMRGAMTHVAVICDHSEIQSELPQVFISNKILRSLKAYTDVDNALPRNIFIVRQDSGWNNNDIMSKLIRLLGKALAPRRGQVAPIIFMDTARCHGHARVLRACRDTGIVPIFIPAKATWLLQPLDTHAFALYKASMRRAYNDAQIDSGNNVLYTVSWIWILVKVTQQVLQGRTWKRSFE